jgi:uncharacterized protein
MSQAPLRVWCVSDGRAGIARQCTAIANALEDCTPITRTEVVLTPRAPQVWLPPNLWPAPLMALNEDERAVLVPLWPDIWIANGRRSIAYSLWVQKQGKARPFVVQLQDPRLDPSLFDLVVPPRHDQVLGANVVETLGAPVWFGQGDIDRAIARHPLAVMQGAKQVLVVLGGNSKRHRFEVARAQSILSDLQKLAQQGFGLLITSSRRTPPEVEALFRSFVAGVPNARFFGNEGQDGPNPYLGWLAQADYALVTEDSTNMITDAAFFGLPVHLLKLEGGDARFDRLHQGFIEAGVARWFEGALMDWDYPPVRDAMTVATTILRQIGR